MLRISELAELAGTTVRTIRHYHAEQVLPEPVRDSAGHRRYGAAALIQLLRVRRLRELGLPLHRIRELDLGDIHSVLDELEVELDEQQRRLDARRRRIAELRRSLDPDLPPAIAVYFKDLAAAGVDPELLAREKEATMLLLALAPDAAANFVRLYRRLREEPAKLAAAMDVMHRFQQLAADPADEQEVQRLVDDLVALYPGWLGEAPGAADTTTAEAASRVFADHLHSYSLAQRRVIEMVSAIAPRARTADSRPADPACPDVTSHRQD